MSNLTLESAVMRHALRYGGTAAVGLALVMSIHLVKGYWVLITIAVVLRPYAAITLQRTVLRCGGQCWVQSSPPAFWWRQNGRRP